MRHYSRLAALNFSISQNFYPLGSCTMKYNPVSNEQLASLAGFADLHPYQEESSVQGALELLWLLGEALSHLVGVDKMTLQPAAGAHGEWTALRMIQEFHRAQGEERDVVLVPDSSHGTNPASAALCGFKVVEIRTSAAGRIDLDHLRRQLSSRVAALMLTNPNTLGLFESDILEVADLVHDVGGKLYYDGANLNALMGICRPGDMGFDAVHLNLHKTFTTPHGGGGPGAGPVGVKRELEPFLPRPTVERREQEEKASFYLDHDRPQSLGRVRSFTGNFGMLVRAYGYVLAMGGDGLEQASEDAILAANYLRQQVGASLEMPYGGPCMHEFVASASHLAGSGVRAIDVAKGLLERGYHAPTVAFPLTVPEALMIEPTETESRATLDAFAAALAEVVELAERDPQALKEEPRNLPIGRLDEVSAARHPLLRWHPSEHP
jgi:glycine dehydrogenase subunit 2